MNDNKFTVFNHIHSKLIITNFYQNITGYVLFRNSIHYFLRYNDQFFCDIHIQIDNRQTNIFKKYLNRVRHFPYRVNPSKDGFSRF